ncbi:hypothetical protein GmHk_18G053478 [Glycine max]|nr:hypothetical protein GmHk_18G053478 [Glycine max]KAH1200334.1 hypothetical protein GmHk_18G053478 [Glycine max]
MCSFPACQSHHATSLAQQKRCTHQTYHQTPRGTSHQVLPDHETKCCYQRRSASTGTKLSGDSSAKPLSFSGAIVDSIARFQFLILVDRVRRVLWCFLGHTVAICITQWVVAR